MPIQVLLQSLARLWLSRWATTQQCALIHPRCPHQYIVKSWSSRQRKRSHLMACAADGLAVAQGPQPMLKACFSLRQ